MARCRDERGSSFSDLLSSKSSGRSNASLILEDDISSSSDAGTSSHAEDFSNRRMSGNAEDDLDYKIKWFFQSIEQGAQELS